MIYYFKKMNEQLLKIRELADQIQKRHTHEGFVLRKLIERGVSGISSFEGYRGIYDQTELVRFIPRLADTIYTLKQKGFDIRSYKLDKGECLYIILI